MPCVKLISNGTPFPWIPEVTMLAGHRSNRWQKCMAHTIYNWNFDVSWTYHLWAIDHYLLSPVKILPPSSKTSFTFHIHPFIKLSPPHCSLLPLSPFSLFPLSLFSVFLTCFLSFKLLDFLAFFLLLVRLSGVRKSYKCASLSSTLYIHLWQ